MKTKKPNKRAPLSELLRAQRKNLGIGEVALQRQGGLKSPGSVHRWETGTTPIEEHLPAIAHAWHLPLDVVIAAWRQQKELSHV